MVSKNTKKANQNIEGNKKGEVLLYKNKLEVVLIKETIWLSLNQIADLFGRNKSVISRHLNNIYQTNELNKKSTVALFATVQKEGGRPIKRNIEYFNLDAILSVGYRVNSKRGTQFRIWATGVLKKHLIDGYTINEKRLRIAEKKYRDLQNSVRLLSNVINSENVNDETKGLIQVISEYSKALDILDDYDHNKLSKPIGTKRESYRLNYDEALKIVEAMKMKFKNSNLFGAEKDRSFESSIGAIYQTFNGKELYPTIEEKAAHLLYFVTKNHSFVDGNKRIAAAIFIYFMQKNGILKHNDGTRAIDSNSLAALTLMIALSKPSEKDAMIKVTMNLLA